MQILIIEDELLSAKKLEQMILRFDKQYQILDTVPSVEKAVAWFQENEMPDLIFMDVELMDGNCFDIIRQIEISCPVIFTTAYEDRALDAFQVHSVDYLLKPVNYGKLQLSLQKLDQIRTGFQREQRDEALAKPTINTEEKEYKSRFLVKSGEKLFSISVDEVYYLFSEGKVTFLLTRDEKKYYVNYSLNELEELLDPKYFFRINRQAILHFHSIEVVHRYFKGRLKIELCFPTEEEIIVSNRRTTEFQQWLDR